MKMQLLLKYYGMITMTLCSKMSLNLFALMQKKVNDARREYSMHDSNVDQEHPLGCLSQDSLQ